MKKEEAVSVGARECLATALVRLCREKPLSSITVTELCEDAGVSRMAFYRNYSSKEEILSSKLQSLIEDYREVTRPLLVVGDAWYSPGHLQTCFEFLLANKDFVDCLFRCGFIGLFVESLAEFLIGRWGNGTPEGDYILIAFAGSLCACYPRWAERGFAESPRRMASLLGRFYTSIQEPNR